MSTQISRDSFRPDRRYSAVHQQQGRMITDADWNDQADLTAHRLAEALADVIGGGVPRGERGLAVSQAAPGGPLALTPGRVYADGLGAFAAGADPEAATFGLDAQADLPLAPGTALPTAGYVVYADLWEREVVSLEDADADPHLRDPGLHGADTCSRSQTMAQLKWCAAAVDPEDPAVNPPQGDARLTVTLRAASEEADPCDPCAEEVGLPARVGDYLLRLEVHEVEGAPGAPDRLTLKWSSENGAEQHRLGREPADFRAGGWTWELTNATTDRHLGVALDGGMALLRGRLEEDFPAAPPAGFERVRRWDGACTLERAGGGWSLAAGRDRDLDLAEDGRAAFAAGGVTLRLRALELTLALDGARFVAGDYWLAAVREAVHDATDAPTVLADAPPRGVRHRTLVLARVDAAGALEPPATDAAQRLAFPTLTTLAAGDVDYLHGCGDDGLFGDEHDTVAKALDRLCGLAAGDVVYQPGACADLAEAATVQEALDILCQRPSAAGCRIPVRPDQSLAELIRERRSRGERHLAFCLLPGEHRLVGETFESSPDEPLDLSLHGVGPGSRLLIEGDTGFLDLEHLAFAEIGVELAAGARLVAGARDHLWQEVRVQAEAAERAPLLLASVRSLRLEGCEVAVAGGISSDAAVAEALAAHPRAAALFAERLTDAAFTRRSGAVAQELATDAASARALALGLRNHLATIGRTLDASRRRTLERLLDALAANQRAVRRIAGLLGELRAAAADAPPALVLPAGGDTTLVDCRLGGVVSLYSEPAGSELNADERGLARQLLGRGILLDPDGGRLTITRCRLPRLATGDGVIEALRGAVAAGGGGVRGTFASALLSDNVFTASGSLLVARDCRLTSNQIAPTVSDLATVIAHSAVYVGNLAVLDDNFVLRNVAPRSNGNTRGDLNDLFIVEG